MERFEERFTALALSNEQLSADVKTLIQALAVITAVEERSVKTEEAVQRIERESIARSAHARRIFNVTGVALLLGVSAASAILYWLLLVHVNDLLRQQRSQSFSGCTTRNAATLSQARREAELAKVAATAAERALHATSSRELAKATIDCTRYLPKK